VPIELLNKQWVIFDAYVDSGASYSIFHTDVAEILGIDIERTAKKIYVTVGDGSQIVVYLHKIEVKFAGEQFWATIGFSRNLGIGFNLIGMKDIFDRFKITFDNRNKILEVTK
jgi:TPP-dependent trihydroxycyclohexane-1,2-dione (THcHDO) dehydratase